MNIWAGAGLLSLAGALRGPGMHPKMMEILCFPCVFNVFWQEIGAQEGVMEANPYFSSAWIMNISGQEIQKLRGFAPFGGDFLFIFSA